MSGRRHATRRGVLSGLSALALGACAAPGRLAMGAGDGPGQGPGEGDGEPRGGIGGTGITADATVAVIGTLTGFGSLRVNGLALLTPARTAASPLGEVVLAPGHVLEAAAAQVDGGLAARQVTASIALAGPVTRAPARQGLQVAGVEVRLTPGAPLPPGGARPGARVAVSGLWRGDVLVASRVDAAPAGAPDVVSGVLSSRSGGLHAGAMPLSGADAMPSSGAGAMPLSGAGAPTGRHAVITGRWRAGQGLVPQDMRVGRPVLEAGLRRLSAEGYLVRGAAGAPAVSGLGAALDPGARIDRLSAGRAVFLGSLEDDGRFRLEHGIPLPEGAADRAAALARIGDGLAPTSGAVATR